MKIYNVFNRETGYNEELFNLTAAKKAMRENNAQETITKVYSNGKWINCGEIELKGSNKTFVANTKQTKKGY